MKILLVAKPWKGGLATYMLNALREIAGDGVRYFPTYPDSLTERFFYLQDKRAWHRNLVKAINAEHYDAAIFINHITAFNGLHKPERNILWLTDGPALSTEDVAGFGKVFLSDTGYAENLPTATRYAGEMPFAHDPAVHIPPPFSGNRSGLCFIANKDAKRDVWLADLGASGIRPIVYGNHFLRTATFWKHPLRFRPAVPVSAMGNLYARHMAALNIHASVVREGTNMRTFECAAYGIPQLVEYRPGLERHFEPGNEILTFSSAEECAEQFQRLAKDTPYARKLAENARRRVQSDHTYKLRAIKMLERLT